MSIKGIFSKLLRGGTSQDPKVTIEELTLRFDDLSTWLGDLTQRLAAIEKQVESTRKKVYRDEEQSEADKLIAQAPPVNPFVYLVAGDPVPAQYMDKFGG